MPRLNQCTISPVQASHLEETGRGDLAEKLKAKYPEALRDNY